MLVTVKFLDVGLSLKRVISSTQNERKKKKALSVESKMTFLSIEEK